MKQKSGRGGVNHWGACVYGTPVNLSHIFGLVDHAPETPREETMLAGMDRPRSRQKALVNLLSIMNLKQ